MENLTCQPLGPEKDTYVEDWKRCLPIHIGDLFTYETSEGIKRYDTYQLDKDCIDYIFNNLNATTNSLGSNILTFAIVMGKRSVTDTTLNPSGQIFQPMLEVSLVEERDGKDKYYFLLNRREHQFVLRDSKRSSLVGRTESISGQLSPQVAQLFIVKWQSLIDVEVISSFEGLAGEVVDPNLPVNELTFRPQRLQRVNQYTFDTQETADMVSLLSRELSNEGLIFNLYLGAGLAVPDYHPFYFRPILAITYNAETGEDVGQEELTYTEYYDTSRPCPPFCPSV